MGEAALREVAVGYFGSSNNSMWGEDDYLQLAWFDQIFEGGRHRMGVYTINGLIDMYNNYSSGSLNYYMDMEIFGGDPTMELFTEIPASLNVTHDAALIIGQSDFTVTVRRGGGLLAGARVCLTKTDGGDDVQAFGLTDASGTVTLTLSPAPASVGTMDVTVTAVNAVPYEGAVEIIVPDGPYLTHDSHAVDDSAGNGDGIVNPGSPYSSP